MSDYVVARASRLLLGVLAATLVLIGGLTWDRFDAMRSARVWSQHTYEVLGKLKDLSIGMRDAETGQRGYLLTGDEDYLAPYKSAVDRVAFLQGELQRLTADSPVEQDRLRTLSPILQRKLEELAQTVQLRRTVGLEPALRIVRTNLGLNLTKRMEAVLSAMTAEEEGLLVQREAATDRRGTWVRALVFGVVLLAILGLLWAARMLRRAWSSSIRMAAEQSLLSSRLRASLDSLSQGVGVFDVDAHLIHWNNCFQVLLALPRGMARAGTPYVAFVEQAAEAGLDLESEEQIRLGRRTPGHAVVYERPTARGNELELRRTPNADC